MLKSSAYISNGSIHPLVVIQPGVMLTKTNRFHKTDYIHVDATQYAGGVKDISVSKTARKRSRRQFGHNDKFGRRDFQIPPVLSSSKSVRQIENQGD